MHTRHIRSIASLSEPSRALHAEVPDPAGQAVIGLVRGMPGVVLAFVEAHGRLERVAESRAATEWLHWVPMLGAALEQVAARGASEGCASVLLTTLGGSDYRIVSWRADSGEERRPLAKQRWGLTDRQADVVALLGDGHANKSIGTILGISEATVEIHMTRALEKAGVENRTALVAAFWRLA